MIIAFSGTDGAGKTTQISLLTKDFEAAGKKTSYVWARGGYTPLFTAVKSAAKRAATRSGVVAESSYAASRERVISKPVVARLWLIAALVDMIILYALYVRLLHRAGHVVICDRYVGDTRIDFCRNFPAQFSTRSWLWRLLRATAPTPDAHFVLHVPVEVSIRRSREKNEPFPDTRETLEYRLNAYLGAADFADPGVVRIDCQAPIAEVHEKIKEHLSSALQI